MAGLYGYGFVRYAADFVASSPGWAGLVSRPVLNEVLAKYYASSFNNVQDDAGFG